MSTQRGSVRDFVTSVAAGRVAGKQEATLRAEIGGTVRVLHHRRGERVKEGEPLLSYDPNELRDRLKLAETSVLVARAQSLQAEQNASLAESNLARGRRVRESGSISQSEFDNLEGQARTLSRAVDAARAAIVQAQANVDVARTALRKAVLRAPFDGVVLATSVEPGETSTPGAPLVTLADISALHVVADVDEADVGRIALGMPVDLSLDAFPGERLRGSLREIAPSVTRDARGGRSVAIEVALPSDSRLRVGMSADVDIIVAVHDGVLSLPPNVVHGRGAERSVFVVERGVARKRTVDVGISTWEAVEIRSGLSDGEDVVAMQAGTDLKDGAEVAARRVEVSTGAAR
jgi:HlyD family secretion protein